MDEGFSLIQVICWTIAGMVLGGFIGWQLRIAYDARAAARTAVAKTQEMEDLLVNRQLPEWDGHDRRSHRDKGASDVRVILVICLMILAGCSSAWGVVVATNAQASARCYTDVNREYARTIEIRAVEAGQLDRDAETLDRQALDRLVSVISLNLDTEADTGSNVDARPAFREYRAQRALADGIRKEADTVREENPYPTDDQCE